MRGSDTYIENLFTMRTLEDFVPADHPLRPIRRMVNAALLSMKDTLSGMYADPNRCGRPSIAPEKLLQVFYSIRSERQLMEQTQYNLLFRWFIGLVMDDDVWAAWCIILTGAHNTSASATASVWPKQVSSHRWAAQGIATTTRWRKRSTGCARPN